MLDGLAGEHRHVASAWRALILIRRATFALGSNERRWERLPNEPADISPLLNQMRRAGQLSRIPDGHGLDRVGVAYARQAPIDEREVLFELNPYAVLSHITAMVFHGLSIETPKRSIATVSRDKTGGLYPIGTRGLDWEDVALPAALRPKRVMGQQIEWNVVRPERFFGFIEYEPFGYPLRYTTLERTLIDGLQDPALSGGIASVLSAWRLARDRIRLDQLIELTERYRVALLRQRVGFVLDQLGLKAPRVERWRASAQRGGSSRLVASAPFASSYDERWNLSINAPIDALREPAW